MKFFEAKPTKKQEFQNTVFVVSGEGGSIVVWIMIAVALFAAIGFVVSRNTENTEQTVEKEKNRLVATEIIEYAQGIKTAVHALRVNGCTDTQISFENSSSTANYTNANAPADDSCNVFSSEGGGMIWEDPPSGSNNGDEYVFTGDVYVEDVGTGGGAAADSDLVMVLPNMTLDICNRINSILEIPASMGEPPQDSGNADYSTVFTGSYTAGDQIGSGTYGLTSACFEGGGTPASGTYHFYQVLIAR